METHGNPLFWGSPNFKKPPLLVEQQVLANCWQNCPGITSLWLLSVGNTSVSEWVLCDFMYLNSVYIIDCISYTVVIQ